MNEQTTKLLEQLANKLGTTSEYLWSILLRQAPVEATIGIIQLIILLSIGLGLWVVHKKLMQKKEGSRYGNSYDEYEAYGFIVVACSIMWLVVTIVFLITQISGIIAGYFNPEYWALKEILNALRGCN